MVAGMLAAAPVEIAAVVHPDESFPRDKTVVWTPLFQEAWDALNRELGGPPVKVEPSNSLMAKLDDFKWDPDKVMPVDRWKVWVGPASPQLIEKANREAAQMLEEAKGPFEGATEGLLALALLDKNLKFQKSLHRSINAPLSFHVADAKELPVRFFGSRKVASAAQRGHVRVLTYDENSRAVQIAAEGNESAVFYMPKTPESFMSACDKIRGWRTNGPNGNFGSLSDPQLHENDDLRIPYVKFFTSSDFKSRLAGARYFQRNNMPWEISKAQQRVNFELTEKGAKVRVEVELAADPFGAAPPPPPMIPRQLVFDHPFFIFLWRDDADLPYFGVWVGDGGGLENFKLAE